MSTLEYTVLDRLLIEADRTLKAFASGRRAAAPRPNPSTSIKQAELPLLDRRLSGRLMRVNHAGEVSAQALYQGQAITARSALLRDTLERSAVEENDHFRWCAQRLAELKTSESRLNPLWYTGSLAIGAAAGLAGDRISLGFLEETERQVVAHLDAHLKRLPGADARSRAILEQMRIEESHHQNTAREGGAARLPALLRTLMRACSNVMTNAAFWV